MQYAEVVVVAVVVAAVVVVIVAFVVRSQFAERWLVVVVDCHLLCRNRTSREEILLRVRCRHWPQHFVCFLCLIS